MIAELSISIYCEFDTANRYQFQIFYPTSALGPFILYILYVLNKN